MELIPKISLTDSPTWVFPTKSVCISILEVKRGLRYFQHEYFQDKTIIISGIYPDEFEKKYSELIEEISSIFDKRFLLTTADCATYGSMNQFERNSEIQEMLTENQKLYSKYSNQKFIGILAGFTKEEYQWTYEALKPYCDLFLIYLTGYIRSNPKWFNLPTLLNEIFPGEFSDPLICYGFNEGSLKHLPELKKQYNIQYAISESYRTKAIYNGNPHYSRKVKMQKAWEKKLEKFG